MPHWEVIDSSTVPGGESVLTLHQLEDGFAIFVDHRRLMDSRVVASERTIAQLACEHLAGRSAPYVLIGGLGMGMTLRAALDGLPSGARIELAELVPAVVRWNREYLGAVNGRAIEDPRVTVYEVDVAERMKRATPQYDAILLDVDNGPWGLTRESNDDLYAPQGLEIAYAALKSGGVLNVWSATPEDAFTRRLEAAGFEVREEHVHSGYVDSSDHVIWVAVRP